MTTGTVGNACLEFEPMKHVFRWEWHDCADEEAMLHVSYVGVAAWVTCREQAEDNGPQTGIISYS